MIADVIFVISQATKKDYIQFVADESLRLPKVKRIKLGEDYTSNQQVRPSQLVGDQPYILSVGTIEVRKNHALLYATYKRAIEKCIILPRLVIVGRQGWLSGDIYYQMVHDREVSKFITFIHDANDQQLSWLYSHCLFTVFPSFYEGWGLPVAEAAFYGKTCAASNTSSIPEVVGDGAVYYSPYSTDDCLSALEKLMGETVRNSYESIIASRRPLTWDDAYKSSQLK